MYKIAATRNGNKRTGEARTLAGLSLAAVKRVQSLIPLEERSKLLPPQAVSSFVALVSTGVRENHRAFTVSIADINVEFTES